MAGQGTWNQQVSFNRRCTRNAERGAGFTYKRVMMEGPLWNLIDMLGLSNSIGVVGTRMRRDGKGRMIGGFGVGAVGDGGES